ncbi:MAG: protein phosphatase 2C domain-containing protein [Nitrospinota bacterium]|nr:protein phosphatase 2C domain-containing protein [Nitrospinota bacterium]
MTRCEKPIAIDAYYAIGAAHKVCEDYALAKGGSIPHLVVADGCSGSAHSDVGARILAWSAASVITCSDIGNDKVPFGYDEFGRLVNIIATDAMNTLPGLRREALDATALAAIYYRKAAHVYAYGDGVIVGRRRDGEIVVIEIEYAHNMPFYLSYWGDCERRSAYHAASAPFEQGAVSETTTFFASDGSVRDTLINTKQPDDEFIYSFDEKKYEMVAVLSDGVGSFVDGDGERIKINGLATNLTDLKSHRGEFIQRRAKRELKTLAKQGVSHQDDFSIGAMLM